MSDEETRSGKPVTGEEWREAVASLVARLEAQEAFARSAVEADAKWRAEETERMKRGHAEAIARQDAQALERIRDGFAASALEGMISTDQEWCDDRDLAATEAYRYADAMMRARKP